MRFALRCILAGLLLCVSAATQEGGVDPDCTLCAAAHEIDCPTCEGAGTRLLSCTLCDGSGRRECKFCSGKATLRCPNPTCKDGRVGTGKSAKDCKVCPSKGRLDCKMCVGGKRACGCGKDHERHVGCTDCSGSKKIPCPACRLQPHTDKCLGCDDKKRRPCQTCADATFRGNTCAACLGKRKISCRSCRGHRKLACRRCSGRGVQLERVVDKKKVTFKSARCAPCKGRGHRQCTECEKSRGRIVCGACDVNHPKARKTCGLCRKGELPCGMCTDGQLGIARFLGSRQRYPLAIAYAKATQARLEVTGEEIERDYKKTVQAMEALAKLRKDRDGKYTPTMFQKMLAATRGLGILRRAREELVQRKQATVEVLADLQARQKKGASK